jgi:hypothetical protein
VLAAADGSNTPCQLTNPAGSLIALLYVVVVSE